MKTIISSILLLCIGLSSMYVSAATTDNVTDTLTVYGNCGMCKDRIESALKKNPAIKKASWNQDTKVLTVTYDVNAISLTQIHQTIADAGHDTNKVTATDESYSKLAGCCCCADCCKYTRKGASSVQEQHQCGTQTSNCCNKSKKTCCSKMK